MHNGQHLEAANMPLSKWMDKWTVARLDAGILFSMDKGAIKTQRKLKLILLSERSQSEKVIYCMIPTIEHCIKDQSIETAKRLVVGGLTDE